VGFVAWANMSEDERTKRSRTVVRNFMCGLDEHKNSIAIRYEGKRGGQMAVGCFG
jgi:hypothetical protein